VLTELDPAAVSCALRNAARNGIDRVDDRVGSLFAPVRGERIDNIIATERLSSAAIKARSSVLNSEEFKFRNAQAGGYDTQDAGRIVCESFC
jgi:hypothetical protein